jgi:uncharacterized membrane protein
MTLASGLLAVALVTVGFRALPALARPTLPFGVRVPPDRVDDPAVGRQRHRYARRVEEAGALAAVVVAALALLGVVTGLVVTGLVVTGLVVTGLVVTGLVVTGLVVTGLVVTDLVVTDLALFLLASRAVRAAKLAGAFYAGTRQAVTADMTLRTDPVRMPWTVLAAAVAVLLVTAAVGLLRLPSLPPTLPALGAVGVDPAVRTPTTTSTAFAPVVQQAVSTVLAPVLVAVVLRARPELDAADPAGSAQQYRHAICGAWPSCCSPPRRS